MGQSTREIEAHIDDTRRELSRNLNELEDRVKAAADLKRQVEKRPMAFLGAAFAVGTVLAAVLKRKVR